MTTPSDDPPIAPGAPTSEPPADEEPIVPRPPLPPKPEQRAPAARSATGRPVSDAPEVRSQTGEYLTTAQGLRLPDTDHSLRAGPRGPTLLQDHHLREKITHFDHERIPERVVHARGAAAHGVFTSYGTAAKVCGAQFLAEGVQTPTYTRFSTVAGSRGSADTVRDTRGFATKFYTEQGNFDLVGNNIPVFFIQDAIKFPDIVHAVKPHPDREIPQAQSAHDTFWDFVSLHTEATHHVMWQMSDRAVPRSYRMMEGFGIHTFRLVAADGSTTLVKFHWKPLAGVHSLVWEEAQITSGVDPDFHRRDLADAIETGALPEYELGLQLFPDTSEQTFEGIDLLDPTKIVPEELAPVQPVGKLTLNANPTNYFAETEQVAFHPGHLVPGIDVTDDPLLAGRLFSYLDTQISRLGGPNFAQIPINRPHAPVNDMLRDGMHQTAVHSGAAPYRPNSLDGGCPFRADTEAGGYVEVPQPVPSSRRVREAPESFADHFSQPRLFWLSLSPTEQDHTVQAFCFELGKCYETAIRQRMVDVLSQVDGELAGRVAGGLGLKEPSAGVPPDVRPSPALAQITDASWPVAGRLLGILTSPDTDPQAVRTVRDTALGLQLTPLVITPNGGPLAGDISAQRSYLTARSVEFDALLVAGPLGEPLEPAIRVLLSESFRHGKPIGGWDMAGALLAAGCPDQAAGVMHDAAADVVPMLADLLSRHRVWERLAT